MSEHQLVSRIRARLGDEAWGTSTVSAGAAVDTDRPWRTLASSHLGHSRLLQAHICRHVSRSLLQARHEGDVLLIAAGSAIEPWARRAAELFAVPTLTLWVNPKREPEGDSHVTIEGSRKLQRDAVVVSLADKVDCPLVRGGGNIEAALRARLSSGPDARVRVAISEASDRKAMRCAEALMDRGAVGWYIPPRRITPRVPSETPIVESDWARTDDQWLVHCTRAAGNHLPGQSERQSRDALLLGQAMTNGPMETLMRIVRGKRLIASATASDRRYPVVCFSSRSLRSLLAERAYRSHLHRWDYEPFGIAIRKDAAVRAGLRPVIYGQPAKRDSLADHDRYRFQATGNTYDWTREREWRSLGDVDLSRFDSSDVRVFVPETSLASSLGTHFPVSVVASESESART